jgi:hypothetical protein
MMRKYIKKSTSALLVAALVMATQMFTYGDTWDGGAGDGLWTSATNWNNDVVPTIDVDAVNWTDQGIILDAPAVAKRFWSRHLSGNNKLTITTNGVLTVATGIELNEFSGSAVSADLVLDGGAAVVSNNLSVAGQNTSQGGARVFLNSGSIDVLNNVKIGTAGQGVGVDGEVTVNGGVFTVQNQTLLGGGNLDTDTGTLIINGGLYIEGTGGSTFEIGAGAGSGTVALNGGVLINNNALELDVDASNDVGTASINFNGGEFWQMDPSVTIQDESTLDFQKGVLYWSGNQVAALTDLVANSNVTYVLGLTNMLTESWDASWTDGFTLDYGYWSKSYGSALYADVDDVTNGYTTVWAMNLSPDVVPPVSDGITNTYSFNNGSGDQVWTTAENWDILSLPTGEDTVNHTSVTNMLIADNDVAALDLNVAHSDTSGVSAVTYGSLTVNSNVTLGGWGGSVGRLLADGGDITVGGSVAAGDGLDGVGLIELNSGAISVGNGTVLGDWDAGSMGVLTVNGGTYTQDGGELALGTRNGSSSGTLIINGGEVIIQNDAWNPLRVADGAGSATIIINDGMLNAIGMQMDWGDTDDTFGAVLLNGGEFRITGGFGAACRIDDNSYIQIDKGVFKWNGNQQSTVTNYIENGYITWTNGLDTMLAEDPAYSYTNGLSSLHVAQIDGATTVWAYTPPPPEVPPVMSIAASVGGLDVSVINLDVAKSYELQSTTMLTLPSWSGVGTTSGVSSATWNVPASEPAEFFQVEEQAP